MAAGQSFSYNKIENAISFGSTDFIYIILFLKGKNFRIQELFTLIDNTESSLLLANEISNWIKIEHHIYLSNLIEEDNSTPICYAKVEIEHGGIVVYSYGKLYVKYPMNVSLKNETLFLLEAHAYYTANMIWEFCCAHPEEILLDILLCKEEKDITNEFDTLLAYIK